MSPFNNEGNNRQEDIRLKTIARGRLTGALAQEAAQVAALVTSLVGRINERGFREASVDRLWAAVENSPRLREIQARVDNLAAEYSEFQAQAVAARGVVERQQRARIQEAKAPQIYQRKFSNTHLRHGAYAVA